MGFNIHPTYNSECMNPFKIHLRGCENFTLFKAGFNIFSLVSKISRNRRAFFFEMQMGLKFAFAVLDHLDAYMLSMSSRDGRICSQKASRRYIYIDNLVPGMLIASPKCINMTPGFISFHAFRRILLNRPPIIQRQSSKKAYRHQQVVTVMSPLWKASIACFPSWFLHPQDVVKVFSPPVGTCGKIWRSHIFSKGVETQPPPKRFTFNKTSGVWELISFLLAHPMKLSRLVPNKICHFCSKDHEWKCRWMEEGNCLWTFWDTWIVILYWYIRGYMCFFHIFLLRILY